MYKLELTLNNLQWLICHKTKRNETNHLVHFSEFLPCSFFKNGPKHLTKKDCPGIYSFDEISAANFGFKKFSSFWRYSFFTFSFISFCLQLFTVTCDCIFL